MEVFSLHHLMYGLLFQLDVEPAFPKDFLLEPELPIDFLLFVCFLLFSLVLFYLFLYLRYVHDFSIPLIPCAYLLNFKQ